MTYHETTPGKRWEGSFHGVPFWIVKHLSEGKDVFQVSVKLGRRAQRTSARTLSAALGLVKDFIGASKGAELSPVPTFEEVSFVRSMKAEIPAGWSLAILLQRALRAQRLVGYENDFSQLLAVKADAGTVAMKPSMTTLDCFKKWDEEQRRRDYKNHATHKAVVARFCTACPGPVSAISPEFIQEYINTVRPVRSTGNGQFSYRSLAQYIAALKSFFESCRRQNALPLRAPLPSDGVRVPEMTESPKGAIEFYTIEEVLKLRDALFPSENGLSAKERNQLYDLRFSFAMQFFGGVRPKSPGLMSVSDLLTPTSHSFSLSGFAGKNRGYQSFRGPTLDAWLAPYDETEERLALRQKLIQAGRAASATDFPPFPVVQNHPTPAALKMASHRLLAKTVGRIIHEGGRKTFSTYLFGITHSIEVVARAIGDTPHVAKKHYINQGASLADSIAYFSIFPPWATSPPPSPDDIRRAYGVTLAKKAA